jgi:hypothetical protein
MSDHIWPKPGLPDFITPQILPWTFTHTKIRSCKNYILSVNFSPVLSTPGSSQHEWRYSKLSLIWLQLIRFEIRKILFTAEYIWDLDARGLSEIVEGRFRDWNHTKNLGLMNKTLDFSYWQRKKYLQWYFFIYLLSSALPILLFSIYLFSKFLVFYRYLLLN